MQFDGFSVDHIGSFRQHFLVADLLEAIDIQIVFANWINSILKSGGLDMATIGLIREVQDYFDFWTKRADDGGLAETMDLSRWQDRNADLCRKFMQWESKIGENNRSAYHSFCMMFCLLLEVGEYSVSSEEEEIIYSFLIRQELVARDLLKVYVMGQNRVSLFCGEQFVTDIPLAKSVFYRENNLVSVAENQDTGYLGITAEGDLLNGSAFELPEIGSKVVKTCINQGAYAILLEDGSIVHNLRDSILPEAPVKNIDLFGEQLSWQLME